MNTKLTEYKQTKKETNREVAKEKGILEVGRCVEKGMHSHVERGNE